MHLFQNLKCTLGIHRRDARKVVRDGSGRFTSVCAGCATPMWRYMVGWSSVRRNTEIVTASGDAPLIPARH